MKLHLTFAFFLLIGVTSSAQNHKIADKYWDQANIAVKQGNIKYAAELFEMSAKTEKLSRKIRLKNLFFALSNASGYHLESGNYDKALEISLESKTICESAFGRNSDQFISTVNWIADLYYESELYEKALSYYLELTPIVKKDCIPECEDYQELQINLAATYEALGLYKESLLYYSNVLESIKFDKTNTNYIFCKNKIAVLYRKMGLFKESYDFFVEVLNIAETTIPIDSSLYSIVLNDMALLYNDIGMLNEALPFLQKSLDITMKIEGESANYSNTLNNLANLYRDMGKYDKAINLYYEALVATENTYGKTHSAYGTCLSGLSILYQNLGQYDKALELIKQELENTERSLKINHPYYSFSLINLSDLYRLMGKCIEALEITNKIINENQNIINNLKHFKYTVFNNHANNYACNGDYYNAIHFYNSTLEYAASHFSKKDPRYGTSLNNLGTIYFKLGLLNEALLLFQEALENTNISLGVEHPKYASSLKKLAITHWALEKDEQTLPLFISMIDNIKSQIQLNFSFLTENEKENYLNIIISDFELAQSFLNNYYSNNKLVTEKMYDIELLTKGLILSCSKQIRSAKQSNNETIKKTYEDWYLKRSSIAKQYSLAINSRNQNLKEWEEEAESLERELVKHSNQFKEAQKIGKATWKDVRNYLTDNEVAIEFSSFQYRNNKTWTDSTIYTALILKKGHELPVLVQLFEQNQLNLIVNNEIQDSPAELYRGSIGNSTKRNMQLYNLVWKPLEDYIKEGETIYYSPSGTLHQIAFSAIVTPNGKYLCDKYNLKRVSSTANILNKTEQVDIKNIVAFGGIDYDSKSLDISTSLNVASTFASRPLISDLKKINKSWNYLPGTLKEINSIYEEAEKSAISVTLYHEKLAVEEQFKLLNGMYSPTILHIASHGFFFSDPNNKKRDDMLLQEEKNVYKLSDNPLNRTGLLFAGANKIWNNGHSSEESEDGILTAYEISNIFLPNTKLVVLSACETGLGDIKGNEGVYGLQRAFKMAGVEYILMSLWKVPDTETAEFMEKFYQLLFTSKDIERSYRKTQQFMKGKYPKEPYKWAAFVLMR